LTIDRRPLITDVVSIEVESTTMGEVAPNQTDLPLITGSPVKPTLHHSFTIFPPPFIIELSPPTLFVDYVDLMIKLNSMYNVLSLIHSLTLVRESP
jgi:hypothetical protein